VNPRDEQTVDITGQGATGKGEHEAGPWSPRRMNVFENQAKMNPESATTAGSSDQSLRRDDQSETQGADEHRGTVCRKDM